MINLKSVPAIQLHRHLGAIPIDSTKTRFCVWSPTCERVSVQLVDQDRSVVLRKAPAGYHMADVDNVKAGDHYRYEFQHSSSGQERLASRPDPASRYQPDGVHGPSEVIDAKQFAWTDHDWQGVENADLVIYELHVGALTDEGTFQAAIGRLDELVELGITAIELMPVADTAGRWNWGYDGVALFAPNRNYGTPDDLRHLVQEAHRRGLAVILDVVYNHLGPEGNYLGDSGPYLSAKHTTVWGAAPNFDDPVHAEQLRRFFVANAIYWYDEYHIDALRVDAIHCMRDDSELHVAAEISQAAKEWSKHSRRCAKLIAESNVYDSNMLAPLDAGGIGFDAEWCDDFIHSVFAVVRPGEQLCHRSYFPGADLDQTLRYGYVYEGSLRDERGRQSPSARVDSNGLIYSIQHHDFIGNHPLGKRLHQLTSHETQRAAAALLILSPAIPMLFMGEEFSSDQPFQFFVDFTDEHLRQAVVEGRKREYPQHDWSAGILPIDAQAFQMSKIGPAEKGDRDMRNWYRSLLALRKRWRAAGLLSDSHLVVKNDLEHGVFVLHYESDQVAAAVAVRLSGNPTDATPQPLQIQGDLLLDSRPGITNADEILPNHAKVFQTEK